MKKRSLLLLSLSMVLGITFVDGASSSSIALAGESASSGEKVEMDLTEPITIQFWENLDNETYDSDVQKVVDSFNETVGKDLGITVEMTVQSGGIEALETNLVAAIKSGSGVPNVITTEATYVPDYLQAQAIVDLTPYINSGDYGLDMSDYYDVFADSSSSYPEEGIYTLPAFVSGEVMYYQKS